MEKILLGQDFTGFVCQTLNTGGKFMNGAGHNMVTTTPGQAASFGSAHQKMPQNSH
jgi:hypothetical protein